jgi:hypothetical protein
MTAIMKVIRLARFIELLVGKERFNPPAQIADERAAVIPDGFTVANVKTTIGVVAVITPPMLQQFGRRIHKSVPAHAMIIEQTMASHMRIA